MKIVHGTGKGNVEHHPHLHGVRVFQDVLVRRDVFVQDVRVFQDVRCVQDYIENYKDRPYC